MFYNKALHMDPHVSRLVSPVTNIIITSIIFEMARIYGKLKYFNAISVETCMSIKFLVY